MTLGAIRTKAALQGDVQVSPFALRRRAVQEVLLMTPAVTLAVLVAALCHASWNAIIRMRGDKLISMTLLVTASGVIALPGLLFAPVLPAGAWPFLIASALIHVGYNTFLALSYHHGELSKVYPLVRGSAPLLTLVISLL